MQYLSRILLRIRQLIQLHSLVPLLPYLSNIDSAVSAPSRTITRQLSGRRQMTAAQFAEKLAA